MGIGDRDYMRNEGGGAILRGMTAVQGIVALNIAVFLLWQFGDRSFMRDNFLVSYSQLENWRLWTLLTSVFSHNLFWHILINLLVFASFGPALEQRWGSRKFLVFYLGCGIFASLVHCGMHFLDFPDSAALREVPSSREGSSKRAASSRRATDRRCRRRHQLAIAVRNLTVAAVADH